MNGSKAGILTDASRDWFVQKLGTRKIQSSWSRSINIIAGRCVFFRKVHKWLLNRFQSLGFRVLGFRVGNVNIDVR